MKVLRPNFPVWTAAQLHEVDQCFTFQLVWSFMAMYEAEVVLKIQKSSVWYEPEDVS